MSWVHFLTIGILFVRHGKKVGIRELAVLGDFWHKDDVKLKNRWKVIVCRDKINYNNCSL